MSWLKRLLRHGLAGVVYHTGLLMLLLNLRGIRNPDRRFTILMYHRVLDQEDPTHCYTQPGICVKTPTFDQQLQFLKGKYRILSLTQLVTELRAGNPIPSGAVVITFDDGWVDTFVNAFPLLTRHSIPATVFLNTELTGSQRAFWFLKIGLLYAKTEDAHSVISGALGSAGHGVHGVPADLDGMLEYLKTLDPQTLDSLTDQMLAAAGIDMSILNKHRWTVNWAEVFEMEKANVEFGSHGRSHTILTGLSREQAETDIVESKRALEGKLGQAVRLFSYPNGDHNGTLRELVKTAGYTGAVATGGPESDSSQGIDLYALPRVNIHEGVSLGCTGRFSPALFACAIHRVFPFSG